MTTLLRRASLGIGLSFAALLVLGTGVGAAAPLAAQDNWTLDFTFSLQGGAVIPHDVFSGFSGCVDRQGNLYILAKTGSTADAPNVVHVYDAKGNYLGSPPWLQTFDNLKFGADGRFYTEIVSKPEPFVEQYTHRVSVYDASGTLVRIIDLGTDSTSNKRIFAADTDGNLFVASYSVNLLTTPSTGKIIVYSPTGILLRQIGNGPGNGEANLNTIRGLAIAPDDTVVVCDGVNLGGGSSAFFIRTFSKNGDFLRRFPDDLYATPIRGVAVGADGMIYVESDTIASGSHPYYAHSPSGDLACTFGPPSTGSRVYLGSGLLNPASGTVYLADATGQNIQAWRRGFRTLGSSPPKLVPLPGIRQVSQRANSWLDVDYVVMDADSSTVTTALVAYRNGTGLLRDLLRVPSTALQESTAGNLGANLSTGQVHRVTWSPLGSGLASGDLTFELLARDDRPGLIDFDFITLPGNPNVTISRIPLTHADMRAAWAWLLATGDPALLRAGDGEIAGTGGAFTTTFNKNGTLESRTTAAGRAWLLAKLGVREATASELARARQASSPGAPNQFTPRLSQQMGARPVAVNEWGFDSSTTYDSEAWWVVH